MIINHLVKYWSYVVHMKVLNNIVRQRVTEISMDQVQHCPSEGDTDFNGSSTVVPATSGHLRFGAKVALRGRWPFVAGNRNS